MAWLALPPAGRTGLVAVLPSAGAQVSASTVNRKLPALAAFYAHQARQGAGVGELLTTWQLLGGVGPVAALSPSNVWDVGTGPGVPTGGSRLTRPR